MSFIINKLKLRRLKKMRRLLLGQHSTNANSSSFALPAPLPGHWPSHGQGFGCGKINLGEIEVAEVTTFNFIWGSHDKEKGISFYRPVGIPQGFSSLGHYCQPNNKPLSGFLLVAKDLATSKSNSNNDSPALVAPLDYSLVWNSDDPPPAYVWLPESPPGYKSLGFVVTNKSEKPDLGDIRCVREDLVDKGEPCDLLFETHSKLRRNPFKVWATRPSKRGMLERGVSVGTFFCNKGEEETTPITSCLKNFDSHWHSMPELDQIHALVQHYGPTLFCHPEELYFPSSVSWFFTNGARLCKPGQPNGEPVDPEGSNLPQGGTNDGEFWLDLPHDDDDDDDERREVVKYGCLESTRVYVHVKPALGGTFTDLAMWVFSPFNGPATIKIGPKDISLSRTGEHVGDWEHITLRVSNFSGRLHSVYFSQHSGGVWLDACELEYNQGNKAIIYLSKNGHAVYPHPGSYLQGSTKIGIGIRNDCARSNFCVDSSTQYEIIAAEYLRDQCVIEPSWLQFMRTWGPKIVYDSREELNDVVKKLPGMLRSGAGNLFDKLPAELSREEGPAGPKEKNNWVGDERW